MGHNVSAIAGVKSSNFYEQGNAINEIWVDDVELISRLPFGDSDLGQAGWPKGGWPKIPWHQFIIPLKRDMPENITMLARDVNQEPCYCRVSYMVNRGYWSMYQGWWPVIGECYASFLVGLALWLTACVLFSLRWSRFCEELEELMPNSQGTAKRAVDIPTQIRTGQQGKSVITRWFIRKSILLGVSLILLFFAFPATTVVVPWGKNEQLVVGFFANYMLVGLIAFIIILFAFCMWFVMFFFQALHARHMFGAAQPEIVTIPVTPIPGTDTWTVAYLARETSNV